MFNFGQNKSMWGTPGMPMWGGGNNINSQGMWGGGGFFGGAGGQWQNQPIKTMDIQVPQQPPMMDQTKMQQGMGGGQPQQMNYMPNVRPQNQNPWTSQNNQNNPYKFGLQQGKMRPPQQGYSQQNPQMGGNPFMNMGGGDAYGSRRANQAQNPQMQQQNIMQLLQLMQMLRGGQGGGMQTQPQSMGPARAPQGWNGGQDSNRDGSMGNPNPYLYNGQRIIPG